MSPLSETSRPVALSDGVVDCVLGFNRYGAYCVPPSSQHRPVAQAILRSKVWEPETIDFLRRIEGNIIHAGTYYGDFLPPLSRGRGGTVWAFEPNRENFLCAQATVLLNGLKNVRLVNSGLSSKPGSAFIRTMGPDGRALGGMSKIVESEAEGGESVTLAKIDDVVDGPVSAIHLDVESHEQEALEGGLVTIRQERPVLILETPPASAWFERHLTPLGYRPEGVLDGGLNRLFLANLPGGALNAVRGCRNSR